MQTESCFPLVCWLSIWCSIRYSIWCGIWYSIRYGSWCGSRCGSRCRRCWLRVQHATDKDCSQYNNKQSRDKPNCQIFSLEALQNLHVVQIKAVGRQRPAERVSDEKDQAGQASKRHISSYCAVRIVALTTMQELQARIHVIGCPLRAYKSMTPWIRGDSSLR